MERIRSITDNIFDLLLKLKSGEFDEINKRSAKNELQKYLVMYQQEPKSDLSLLQLLVETDLGT